MLSRRSFLGTSAATIAVPHVSFASGQLEVVATTGMIADTARQIGGDLVNVTALMGPGVDPHSYRQTRSDIVAMSRADLVLWHGLYLEAQLEDFLLDLGRKRSVVAVGEAVPQDELISHEDYDGRFDPHVWMVPRLWVHVAEAIQATLSEAAPEHTDTFATNADAYRAELARLEEYAQSTLHIVPEASRVLVTAHDAFGYLGRGYGYEVMGVQGISTESEAGLDRIRTLVNTLVEREIGAVFVESSVSDRNIRALIEGAAAQRHDVKIGGELFSDAMGTQGSYEGTYIGMIDHNVTTIARALGAADVPIGGMNGTLAHAG
ncbi:metal ABC transporter solute-binding protein, Zn/Mn family [Primorskyibacter sp. S187A]|uniref:metal ABC transporter solute-binding protein, Zn/Mn family n=1 Tax=Primorskyibacter sp. S187A TaxID=3415130 RepID=UPI003C7CADE9